MFLRLGLLLRLEDVVGVGEGAGVRGDLGEGCARSGGRTDVGEVGDSHAVVIVELNAGGPLHLEVELLLGVVPLDVEDLHIVLHIRAVAQVLVVGGEGDGGAVQTFGGDDDHIRAGVRELDGRLVLRTLVLNTVGNAVT